MNHLPVLTFNLILFGLTGILCVLGFLFGENRLKVISYGCFMGFFVLLASSQNAMSDVAGKVNLPIATAKPVFVLILCILLFLGAMLSQKKAGSKFRAIPLGIITALFAVGFALSILPSSNLEKIVTDYNLAAMVYNFRYIIMMILVIWLVIIQFIPEKKDDDKKK